MRRAAKRDDTERDILLALTAVGAEFLCLDVFDILVWFRGQLFMLECKTGRGRPTPSQARLERRGWPLHVVRSPVEALAAIGITTTP